MLVSGSLVGEAEGDISTDVRCVLRIRLLGMWDARQKHVRGGTFSINLKFMLKEWRSHNNNNNNNNNNNISCGPAKKDSLVVMLLSCLDLQTNCTSHGPERRLGLTHELMSREPIRQFLFDVVVV